jgi:phosphoribosylformylglycinamidine (FGAM) synthase-like amidotransferase family enzyme
MLGYDAVLLGQYFLGVSNGCSALILKGLVVQVECSFQTPRITDPTTKCHVLEYWKYIWRL